MSRMWGESGQCRQRLAVKISLKIAIYLVARMKIGNHRIIFLPKKRNLLIKLLFEIRKGPPSRHRASSASATRRSSTTRAQGCGTRSAATNPGSACPWKSTKMTTVSIGLDRNKASRLTG